MYEAMLTTVHTLHTQEYLKFNREVHLILIELFPRNAVHIPSILHDKMRTIKNEVSRMLAKVTSHKRALTILLDDNESMAFMNLSVLQDDPYNRNFIKNHEIIEELVEAHLLEVNSLESKLNYLSVILENAEISLSLKLDLAQDKIIVADTTMTIVAVVIAFAAYWTGVFGMSLDNTLTFQNVYGDFEAVFVLTFFIIIGGIPLVVYYFERTGGLPRLIRPNASNLLVLSQEKGAEVLGMHALL